MDAEAADGGSDTVADDVDDADDADNADDDPELEAEAIADD